jgi:heat shock protein HslJ
MSRSFVPTGLVLLAIALAGCATATATPGPTGAGLAGTSWVVTSIDGQSTVPASPPTIAFGADGMLSGTGGCNQYTGPYEIDGGSIRIGDLASTLMLCEGQAGAQQTAFMAALGGATSWRIDAAGALELTGAGRILAEPAAQAPTPEVSTGAGELPGTSWDLAEMGGTGDFARIVPTIEFGSDGRVSGFAGCNTFSGTFATDGSTLTLGPLATTRMACERPASAVEATYLEALSGVTSWSIGEDGRLALEGAAPLRYTPR